MHFDSSPCAASLPASYSSLTGVFINGNWNEKHNTNDGGTVQHCCNTRFREETSIYDECWCYHDNFCGRFIVKMTLLMLRTWSLFGSGIELALWRVLSDRLQITIIKPKSNRQIIVIQHVETLVEVCTGKNIFHLRTYQDSHLFDFFFTHCPFWAFRSDVKWEQEALTQERPLSARMIAADSNALLWTSSLGHSFGKETTSCEPEQNEREEMNEMKLLYRIERNWLS